MMLTTRRALLTASAFLLLAARDSQAANPKNAGPGPVQLIDFNRARMEWLLPSGIRGTWQLISAVVSRQAGTDSEAYLANAVMAGKIFGDGPLPTEPPFSYQVIASRGRHVMIRNSASAGPDSDTFARNEAMFERLDFHLPTLAGKRVDFVQTASGEIGSYWPLQVRVVARSRDGNDWSLQFPVSHVSDQRKQGGRQFQIETGPVLIPKQLLESTGIPSIGDYYLAYVFFNRIDRMDLLIFGRESDKTSGIREFRHTHRMSDVTIEIYSMM